MTDVLLVLQSTEVAGFFRMSRWFYAALNATHVFGVALLVGAIVPLDLRLLGAWPGVPRPALARVLVPMAAAGLAIAVCAGGLLFSARAVEYAALSVFRLKLALVLAGAGAAIVFHARYGWGFETARPRVRAAHALLSMACWIGALVAGRFIAFAGG